MKQIANKVQASVKGIIDKRTEAIKAGVSRIDDY